MTPSSLQALTQCYSGECRLSTVKIALQRLNSVAASKLPWELSLHVSL